MGEIAVVTTREGDQGRASHCSQLLRALVVEDVMRSEGACSRNDPHRRVAHIVHLESVTTSSADIVAEEARKIRFPLSRDRWELYPGFMLL